MGKADTITKEYVRRLDIFADMFNQFLYQGRKVILPGKLTAMTDGNAAYCILAAENENKVNYAMPVKDGLYDFAQLAKQVNEAVASHRKAMDEGKGRKTGSKVSYPKGEEAVNVCLALQEIKAEGRQEGRQEGRLEGQILAYKKLKVPRQDAMRYLMDDYQKDEKEVEALMEMYWK